MSFENLCNLFIVNCVKNKLVFTQDDIFNFSKICNIQPDHKYVEDNLKKSNLDNYKVSRSFFGKEFIHPVDVNPYRVNYNISNIVKELKLDKQKISNHEKLNKVINYIDLLN